MRVLPLRFRIFLLVSRATADRAAPGAHLSRSTRRSGEPFSCSSVQREPAATALSCTGNPHGRRSRHTLTQRRSRRRPRKATRGAVVKGRKPGGGFSVAAMRLIASPGPDTVVSSSCAARRPEKQPSIARLHGIGRGSGRLARPVSGAPVDCPRQSSATRRCCCTGGSAWPMAGGCYCRLGAVHCTQRLRSAVVPSARTKLVSSVPPPTKNFRT